MKQTHAEVARRIAADIPAQLPIGIDWDQAYREAAAELRQDERQALIRVAAGTATVVDAYLLAAALGHTGLFHHIEPDMPARAHEEDAE